MRSKYDFSDPAVKFFYDSFETYYLTFSQTVDETKMNVFMSQNPERLKTYKQYKGWKTIQQYMNLADAVISKGISIEDWTALVDEQIQKAVDPIYQWERLRKHLLECGVSTAYVAKLEDKYVRAIKAKNFEDLTKLADGTNDKARGLIADFTASVCAKVILGSI